MQILLCAATDFEISITAQTLSDYDHRVTCLITGVGLLASAHALTKAVVRNQFDLVIQAGICGSISEDLDLTDTVLVRKDFIGDLGVMENGQFIPFTHIDHLHSPQTLTANLINPHPLLAENLFRTVNAVTVNEVSTDKERIRHYKKLGADIETMEGAALHHVCLQEQVDFLQLRTVSNKIGERNKANWKLHEAVVALNEATNILLKKILS